MRGIGNEMVSGLACLAALLTPLAGTPHVDCLCPNGHVKLFCFNITSPKSGCCCRGMCCPRTQSGKSCCSRPKAPRAAQPDKKATCCGIHQTRPGEQRPGGGANGAERRCCTKTLAAAESLLATPKRAAACDDQRASGDLPVAPPLVRAPAAGSVVVVFGLTHSPGPPADLVTLHRRLVI
jgi:hypothetical protein